MRPGTLISAAVITAWGALGADTALRSDWSAIEARWHLLAAAGLYTAVGAAVGAVLWLALTLQGLVARAVGRVLPRGGAVLCVLCSAAAAAALCWGTARWLFDGAGAQRAGLQRWGAEAAVLLVAASVAAVGWWVLWARRALLAGRLGPALTTAAVGAIAGGVGFYGDLTVLVSLYAGVHELVELFADSALVVGLVMALGAAQRRWAPAATLARWGAIVAASWSVVFVGSVQTRSWIDQQLAHVWRQPLYVGRVMLRVQLLESYLTDPAGWKGARSSRLERLRRRYDLGSTVLSPAWGEPSSRQHTAGPGDLPQGAGEYGVVVFYIDTLRHDVATDPAIMPNLVRLASRTINFRHAYSSASDTVSAMPAILGGRFDAQGGDDLLGLTRRAATPNAVLIPRSARRFLTKHCPAFQFDEVVEIPDYEEGKKVWGYGADQSTAARIVDGGIAWLQEHRDDPHLLWLFHFDVHNWRELNRDHVYGAAKRLDVPDEARLNWRYRSVAAAVDEQLGRFVSALERMQLWDRTVVVVMSDHGEALGRSTFWVHGVFLWESLVHVPLLLHVPGQRPAVVDAPVGLVDLAPTLAPYLAPNIPVGDRHGEDLMGFVRDPDRRRRFPLLMQASQRDTLLRVGLVEPEGRHKLVLPLEAAVAELYDLQAAEPDDAEVSAGQRHQSLRLLDQLVRSPVFPREPVSEEPSAGGRGRQ